MFANLYKKRKEVFDNVDYNIKKLAGIIKNEDKYVEIYLFGSVLSGNYNMASDIDILIISSNKKKIMKLLWDSNYGEPFEFHIKNKNESKIYFKHIKTIKRIL
jgi:predicted nucleotidyltransferase